MVGKPDAGAAAQGEALTERNITTEAEAGVVLEIVEVEPQAQAVLQRGIVGTHAGRQGAHEVGQGVVEHMGFEVDRLSAGLHLEKHAVAGVDQATRCVKCTAVAAVVQDVESLAIYRPVAVDQLNLQRAIQGSQAADVDLVVKAIAGAGRGATDLKHRGGAVGEGQVFQVLHTRRVAGAEHALNGQVAAKTATALEHRIGRQPQGVGGVQTRQHRQIVNARLQPLSSAGAHGLQQRFHRLAGRQRQSPGKGFGALCVVGVSAKGTNRALVRAAHGPDRVAGRTFKNGQAALLGNRHHRRTPITFKHQRRGAQRAVGQSHIGVYRRRCLQTHWLGVHPIQQTPQDIGRCQGAGARSRLRCLVQAVLDHPVFRQKERLQR